MKGYGWLKTCMCRSLRFTFESKEQVSIFFPDWLFEICSHISVVFWLAQFIPLTVKCSLCHWMKHKIKLRSIRMKSLKTALFLKFCIAFFIVAKNVHLSFLYPQTCLQNFKDLLRCWGSEVVWLILWATFCVKFAWSPHLWILRLPPTAQKHAC